MRGDIVTGGERDIFSEVQELRSKVDRLIVLIEGDGRYTEGMLPAVREAQAYVLESRNKRAEQINALPTAIFITVGVTILTLFHQSILISDIRHQIGLDPWPSVVISAMLKIIADFGIVYAGLIMFRR